MTIQEFKKNALTVGKKVYSVRTKKYKFGSYYEITYATIIQKAPNGEVVAVSMQETKEFYDTLPEILASW